MVFVVLKCSLFENASVTIRENVERLIYETLLDGYQMVTNSDGNNVNVDNENVKKDAKEIEWSIMLYSLLMIAEVKPTEIKNIDWSDELLRSIYLTKANMIVCSIGNVKHNVDLFTNLRTYSIIPIETAFLKRSQLLPKRFEEIEANKLKIYEESGITKDDDYTKYYSTVQCKQCKLFHTSYNQLQTRGADEPMTIFWYCYKCKINGRK